MLYLEDSLGNARIQVDNFEIDVIELFLNLQKIFYWVHMFLYPFHIASRTIEVSPSCKESFSPGFIDMDS